MEKTILFRHFLTLSYLLVVLQLNASSIHFVEEGRVWTCRMEKISPEYTVSGGNIPCVDFHSDYALEPYTYTYTMQGDTLISGQTMKKVYRLCTYIYGDSDLHYFCAVREEDRRVYVCYADRSEPVLLYDFHTDHEFTFDIDDVTYHYNTAIPALHGSLSVAVKNMDDIYRVEDWVIDGHLVFKYELSVKAVIDNFPSPDDTQPYPDVTEESLSYHDLVFIEGFGCVTNDPFDVSFWLVDGNTSIFSRTLLYKDDRYWHCQFEELPDYTSYECGGLEEVRVGDYIIGSNEHGDFDFVRGYTSVKSLPSSVTTDHSSTLYDLQGRRLVTEPHRGVFIKDGRKVVK